MCRFGWAEPVFELRFHDETGFFRRFIANRVISDLSYHQMFLLWPYMLGKWLHLSELFRQLLSQRNFSRLLIFLLDFRRDVHVVEVVLSFFSR